MNQTDVTSGALRVWNIIDAVEYIKTGVFNQEEISHDDRLKNAAFRKPPKFSKDCEFRMTYFMIHAPSMIYIDVKPEPKILNVTPIWDELKDTVSLE